MKMPQQMEHRMNGRIPVHFPIILAFPPRAENNCVHVTTRDMSSGGAFIEGGELDIQAGTLVRLTLEATPKGTLVIDAVVLRSEGHGVALMFANNGDDAFDPLTVLLERELDKLFMGRPGGISVYTGPSAALL